MKREGFLNSIKTKVILTMILLVAIPLVIVTIVSAVNFMSKGTEDTVTINDAQAHIVEQSIESVLDQNMRALEVLAKAPSTIAFVSGYEAQKDDIMDQMKQIDENMADGNSTVITNSEGHQMLRTVGDLVEISDREYFQKAMEGTEFVSDIQVSKSTGSRIATFAAPVKDTEGEVIGIVQRNYDLSDFHELLANELIEDKQELVIVDRTGHVIAHSGHEIDPENEEDQSGNQYYTDSRGEKVSDSYKTKRQGDTWMVSWVKEEKSGWTVASCRVQSVALRAVDRTTAIMIIIGALFLIAGIVVAIFMSRSFTAPIKEINESLAALSDGRFVKIDKYEGRKDEFGEIIHETNDVIGKLKEIVSHIKKSAESVNASSEQLAGTSAQITQTADDVSEAVQEIASGATQQADEIQEALENTAVISKNIQAVSQNADSVNQTANEMSEDSNESAGQLERLKKSAGEMGEAIVEISEKIGATEAAVERISSKVAAINSIASQTNLLALNASIEAARAGEAGRGFAVVAEEIGQLADESSNAADEIRGEMDLLLKESQSAVAMAKEVNATTEVEQKKIIEDTVNSIAKLIKGIESSVGGISSITDSAKSCEESRAVVVDSMNDLSAISEENAAASEETAASMQELGAIVTSLAEDANNLKEISNALIEDMKFFKD